jgi:hypothetical protein
VISASRADRLSWTLVDVPSVREPRGSLCFAEANHHVPFAIERVYWIHGIPHGARRGGHAHRSVYELILPAAGEFDVHCDDGTECHTVHLNDPSRGLLLDPCVWRELSGFSPDAMCLVLASGRYDEDEYLRDYSEFAALADARPGVPWLARTTAVTTAACSASVSAGNSGRLTTRSA